MKFTKCISMFIILLCLCGCGNNATTSEPPIIINLPTDNSVNGYRITASQNTENSGTEHTVTSNPSSISSDSTATATYFCASISSTKFHTARCGSAKNIKDANLLTSPDRQYFIDKGYEPCSRCNP